jgi:hypothetical protein
MRFVTACEKQFPIIWHAAANHQPTQRRSRRGLGRRCRAHAAGGAWTGRFPRDQQTSQALAALQRADSEKWWPIIKAANIKGE